MKVAYFLELVPDHAVIQNFCQNLSFFHDVHVYFGGFGFGSTTTPPIDIFLYSHHFSA